MNTTTYDLVAIGGGTAGLVCVAGAATLGARVALIERDRLGGECLNTGCVPSKALLAGARGGADFKGAMSRVRAAIAALAPHDSAERLSSLGVDVLQGEASFRSRTEIAVGDATLRFRRAVIATGSRPAIPDIPGLAGAPYLTNETLFALAEQPRSMAIFGAGPVGCEMAQAFARLGTRVTLIETAPRILPRDDADAAAILARRLEDDGVTILAATHATHVAADGNGVTVSHASGRVTADALLVATGRAPNVEGLGLAKAGIEHDARGIRVDDYLRTTNARVYASGDVCATGIRFTHAADAMSRVALENALFVRRKRVSRLVIPWCTFTTPEVAHVGVDPAEVERAGLATVTVPLADVDRAVIDGETSGFVRIHHAKGVVRGATIVAPHAGEIIAALAVLIRCHGTLADLSATILPYPTVSLALRQGGDAFRREALTPRVRTALERYFRIRR